MKKITFPYRGRPRVKRWLALLSFACIGPVLHANSNPEAGIGTLEYCTPTATLIDDYFIKNFSTTGGFTNITNRNTGQGAGGYTNYTGMIVSQSAGGAVSFNASYNVVLGIERTLGLRIWIDWNNNETFEATEKVYNDITMLYFQSQHNGTFTVPAGTPVGRYRMRVLADADEMNPFNPCQFKNGAGEAEDYTFEVVAPHPTCMPPTALAATLTATTAQLSWQSEGTLFDVEYGPERYTQGTGTMASSVGNPYGVSGLTPDTAYQFYVRKDCGTGDKSPWAGPFRFYTGYCTPAAISERYFINSFTTTGGFANINNTGTTIGTGGYSNYTAQKVSHYEGGVINFNAAFSAGCGFAIWVDWNNNLIFDTGERVFNAIDRRTPATGSITVPAGTLVGNYRMRMRIDYDNNNLLDACNFYREQGRGEAEDYTFEVVPTPPCLPPTDLSASTTFTTAQLSWFGEGTVFDIEYGPAGFVQGTGTLVSSVGNPYDVTGLAPETAYQFYARTDCGARGKSAWTGPFRFFSGYCIPVATGTSNYIRHFSTTGGFANITNLNTGQGTGGYANHTAMTVSQNVGGTVSFSAASSGGIFGLAIWIDWNRNIVFEPSERMFTTAGFTATPTGTITVPAGTPLGRYRMRVLADGNKGNPDNPCIFTNGKGEIEEYTFQVTTPPTCMPPANLSAVNMTFTTAQLTWTSSGTLFDIEYGPAGFTQGTGTMASSAGISYAISGLTPDTAYQFYVRTDCGSGDKSTWSGPFPFFTGYCLPVATSTSYFINSFTTSGGFANINNTGTTIGTGGYSSYTAQKVSHYESESVNFAAAYSSGSGFAIWIDWNNNMVFDTGERVFNTTTIGSSSTGSIAVPAGTPVGNYRMRVLVDYDSSSPINPCGFTNGNGEAEDYTFEVTTPASCLRPTNLSSGNVTITTAELSWTSSGTVFDIEYGPRGFVQGSGILTAGIANPHPIAGLTSGTQYEFYVRTDCGAGDKSLWAGPFSFNTTCGIKTVPYLLDFNGATVPAAPLCTSIQNAGTGNNWDTQNIVNQYGYNSIVLKYQNHYEYPIENPANAWFFTNALQLEAGTNYVLKFQYGNSGGTGFIESMKVNIGTAADHSTMIRNLVDYPAIANNTPLESSTAFTVATSGVYYLGFNAYSAASMARLFVDNIAIDVSLSAPEFGASAFKAYPNPVKDLLYLAYSQEITEVAVFNMVGQQLITTSIYDSKGQIDLSALPSGTYLVKARTADSSTKTLKVIKQ